MNVIEETQILLAKKLFFGFDSQKYVDWAIDLLYADFESESLIILAGLNGYDTEEKEEYFWKSIEELQIDIKKSDYELIENYALFTARQVVENKLKVLDGLHIMLDIVRATDYDAKYRQFSDIDEDIDYLNEFDHTVFNSGLRKDNIEEYVKSEFELFIEIESLDLDDSIINKSICNKCGLIEKPKLKTKRKFFASRTYQIWVCGNCGSDKIEHFSSQTGKRRIIERLKKDKKTYT
jgi:hypothetical protein